MKTCRIPNTNLVVSRLAYGWGSLGGSWDTQDLPSNVLDMAVRLVRTAYEHGITLFDHADIYTFGKSETAFGHVLRQSPGLRQKIVIQSKCGMHISLPLMEPPSDDPHRVNFECEHIVNSVEGSLRRLDTDYLDILLLHRPDALVEPEEVARAFDELHGSGKVRYFGVSNHTAPQIELLKRYVRQPLVVNQLDLSLANPGLVTEGLDVNRQEGRRLMSGYTGTAGLLDYCRLHDIQVQAYSPVRGLTSAAQEARPAIRQAAQMLADLARKKGTASSAIALAWVMRHPAGIVPVTGTGQPQHLAENCDADRITLTRQEWYALLIAAAGLAPVQFL